MEGDHGKGSSNVSMGNQGEKNILLVAIMRKETKQSVCKTLGKAFSVALLKAGPKRD